LLETTDERRLGVMISCDVAPRAAGRAEVRPVVETVEPHGR
jgi:hypothetical protein